jgi:multidrug efflux pump
MPRFFIEHPVFAWVIAIVIMIAGALSITRLPIQQYPNIASPSIEINARYPGASAQTLENSVTQVIEQSLTGIDNMRYFTSTSSSSGDVSVTITFEPETDADIAQVQVQNKLQTAIPMLPPEVQQQGLKVSKANRNFLLVVGYYSEDDSVSQDALGDLLNTTVRDAVARINGVGSVTVFGQPYAMRIWLDPHKLLSYGLTVDDVSKAIQQQNTDISAGQLGGMPSVSGQQINATISAQSRLQTVGQFEQIILRVNTDGSQVRMKDVARVALGAQSYERVVRYKRKVATGLAVSMAAGANALETAERVKKRIDELAQFMPASVKYVYPYDTTPFIKLSIREVVKTLAEAIVLVFLVMFLFMQNLRATLIPSIAVPVVLLGTFAVLQIFGFSINVLTMFAMVLAIGLLVDDAIVVVENVERHMSEEGLDPREATKKSMQQITGALIGIALVLSAVFVPMAFFSGSAGAIYRQFSLTLVSAMTLSVLVAMILTPTLCATLLKPIKPGHAEKRTGFFGLFNRAFRGSQSGYVGGARYMTRRPVASLTMYAALIGGMFWLFSQVPGSFLPNEDQGMMFIMGNTQPGSTIETTLESVKQIEDHLLANESENIEHLFTVAGFSFAGLAQNVAVGFVALKPWDEREREDQSVFSLAGRSMGAFSQFKDIQAFAFYPPPIRELGRASGFDMQLVDRAGLGHDELMKAQGMLLGLAAKNPKLQGVRPNGLSDVPQFNVQIDHEKARALGLSIADINQTLQAAWGSLYINDFIYNNRLKRVYIQADAEHRMLPEDIYKWHVRNNQGEMVPFGSFASTSWTYGSPKLERFNGDSSVNVQGAAAPGVSSSEAMAEMEKLVEQLPKGLDVEWVGLSYEERASGAQAPALYTLSVIVIFLSLAALYESWSVPFSVLLILPIGIAGTLSSVYLAGLNNDIYFQVGMLTTMGLAAKNAILIVEFARKLYLEGHELTEAAFIAARQRFRPIIMTSMAFVLGVLPLALANGAGSASQNAIGFSVIGGMLAATFIAIFFVPLFFVLTQRLLSLRSNKDRP